MSWSHGAQHGASRNSESKPMCCDHTSLLQKKKSLNTVEMRPSAQFGLEARHHFSKLMISCKASFRNPPHIPLKIGNFYIFQAIIFVLVRFPEFVPLYKQLHNFQHNIPTGRVSKTIQQGVLMQVWPRVPHLLCVI